MTEQEMWEAYQAHDPKATAYEAWSYCGGEPVVADKLAALTLAGTKTATASDYEDYLIENDPIPQPGDLSIVLACSGEAVCVIRTTHVTVVPFDQVGARHAWLEGEGDRSLAYWRRVHQEVFSRDIEERGEHFSPDMLVVCEEFELVWPQGEERTQG